MKIMRISHRQDKEKIFSLEKRERSETVDSHVFAMKPKLNG